MAETTIEIRLATKANRSNLGAVRDRLIRAFVNRYEVALAIDDAKPGPERRLVTGMVRRDAKEPGLAYQIDRAIAEVDNEPTGDAKLDQWAEFRLTGDETMTLTVDGEETVFTMKRVK